VALKPLKKFSPRGGRIRTFSLSFVFGLQNTRKNKRFLIFYQLENEIVHFGPVPSQPEEKTGEKSAETCHIIPKN